MRLPIVALLLVLGNIPVAADAVAAELVLPSETCRGMFIMQVTFGEADGEDTTLDLLLDTGSSWTILDPRALRKLARVSPEVARIGPYELGPIKARALPMRDFGLALGRDIDGILGFPDFREVLLTLDYPSGEVRVSSGSLPRPDGREFFRISGRRPHLKLAIGDRRVKFLLDSGFTGRFQLKSPRRLRWSAEPRPATSFLTVHGVGLHEGGRLEGAIRFGPLEFDNPVVILGGGEAQVGWHVLRHFVLTFDQKNNRMRLQSPRTTSVRMGSLIGAGLAYASLPEGLRVAWVFPGSSAEASGLREGDLIVAIDDVPVYPRGCGESRRSRPNGSGDPCRRRPCIGPDPPV
jgi:hypothetical protein